MPTNLTRRQALALPAGIALGGLVGRPARAAEPVKIGLVAALSGPSAKSGEGITRGLTIAIDEINARGGLLGGQCVRLAPLATAPRLPDPRLSEKMRPTVAP